MKGARATLIGCGAHRGPFAVQGANCAHPSNQLTVSHIRSSQGRVKEHGLCAGEGLKPAMIPALLPFKQRFCPFLHPTSKLSFLHAI